VGLLLGDVPPLSSRQKERRGRRSYDSEKGSCQVLGMQKKEVRSIKYFFLRCGLRWVLQRTQAHPGLFATKNGGKRKKGPTCS